MYRPIKRLLLIEKFQDTLVENNNLFNDIDYDKFIQTNSYIYLNITRDGNNILPSIRINKLLSHKCIVISEHCNEIDDALYKDIVYFCNFDEIYDVYTKLIQKSPTELKEEAETKYNLFCEKFNYKNICNMIETKYIKNMAIILSGLHYQDNYNHWGQIININYEPYVENIKLKIYNYFEIEYNIDTFIVTNESPKINSLIGAYKPIDYKFETDINVIKRLKGLEMVLHANIKYDLILLTRFDIYIIKEFTKQNTDINKFNLVSVIDTENECDDNLYIFPLKYLKPFIEIIKNKIKNGYGSHTMHHIKNEFEQNMDVNYICDDRYNEVANLSFFKLRFNFNKNLELIINQTHFQENIIYNSIGNTSNIIINNNTIKFSKMVNYKCHYAWIGYKLNNGTYNLSFDIISDNHLFLPFIKTHDPDCFYKTIPIKKNILTHIQVNINILNNGLLCLIFDNYSYVVNIEFSNIKITN